MGDSATLLLLLAALLLLLLLLLLVLLLLLLVVVAAAAVEGRLLAAVVVPAELEFGVFAVDGLMFELVGSSILMICRVAKSIPRIPESSAASRGENPKLKMYCGE